MSKPLADEVLFGKLKTGGLVKVGVDKKKENLTFKVIPPSKGRAKGKGSKAPKPKEDA